MGELITNEPLWDESHASAIDLSALQAVKAGVIVREAVLARTDAARSQRMVHQADGSFAWYAAQRGVLCAKQTPSCCPEGRRMTFVHLFLLILPA
jgi:hypothetical protein